MRDLAIVLPLVVLLSPAPSPADVFASPEPAAAAKPAAATRSVTGTVVDTTGAVVPGATVTLKPGSGAERTTQSDEAGRFVFDNVGPGPARVTAQVALFTPATQELDAPRSDLRLVLAPLPYTDQVTVQAPSLVVPRVTSATRTDTLLRDVPQSVSVVTRDLVADQKMQGIADVVRYMPGVGIAQGEGNRDTPIFRGNSSTSDFYVDGIRDDVQYFRDLYNVERVEALKGPNGDDLRARRRGRRDQPREPAGRLAAVARARAPARLVAGPPRHRRPGAGAEPQAGAAGDRGLREVRLVPRGHGPRALRRQPDRRRRARRPHHAARRLRVLPRRPHGRPRDPVVRGPALRDGCQHLLRQPGRELLEDHGERLLGAPRAPLLQPLHAAQPHELRRLRQVLPERVPGGRERGGHRGEPVRLQQRHEAAELLQPDRPGDLRAHGKPRAHAARRGRARPPGVRQRPHHRRTSPRSAPSRPASTRRSRIR